MERRTPARPRAVRLTDEGLLVLQDRLDVVWRDSRAQGRLTRVARAGLMEVSVVTATRILERSGNDRAVLRAAFENLGLKWEDRFAESVPLIQGSDPVQKVASPAPARKRGSAWSFASVALSLTILAAGVGAGRMLNPSLPSKALVTGEEAIELGRHSYHAGHYRDAWVQSATALALAIEAKEPGTMVGALRLQGDVLAAEGRVAEAVQSYEKATEVAESFGLEWHRGSLLEALGTAQGRMGQFALAESNLRRSLSLLEGRDRRGAAGTARSLGELSFQKGDAVTARRWYKEARDLMGSDPDRDLLHDMRAHEALLLSGEGRHSKSLAELDECLSWWRRKGHDRWIAKTLLQLATVHEATKNRRAARQAISEALARYERIADRTGVAQAQRHLSRLNSTPHRARAAG